MKLPFLILPAVLTLLAAPAMAAMAANCSIDIDSSDSMMFDKNEIVIDKTCDEFTINLTHSGKLPAKVMGHNVVISKTGDALAIARDAMSVGLENNYLPPGDERVIAFTEIIGGGEKTAVTFKVNKLKAEEDYTFFCSFPGHISLMRGAVILQ